jgi:IS1 family transposase
MANNLKTEKKIAVISALCEGNSISGIGRMTGIHLDTIMRLGVRVGQGCKKILDEKMRNLEVKNVQVDEMWGFIKAKQKTVIQKGLASEFGDVWTWVALDADTKLVPCFKTGKRDIHHAYSFIFDLKRRVNTRPQISSDSLHYYKKAIAYAFGKDIDYGTVVKVMPHSRIRPDHKYSQTDPIQIKKDVVYGKPDMKKCSTSFVEKQNHTVRMHCRRLARLTNAFSKKRENFDAAVALHYTYYNFCKRHIAIRCTPAMEAGIASSQWTVADLVEMIEA